MGLLPIRLAVIGREQPVAGQRRTSPAPASGSWRTGFRRTARRPIPAEQAYSFGSRCSRRRTAARAARPGCRPEVHTAGRRDPTVVAAVPRRTERCPVPGEAKVPNPVVATPTCFTHVARMIDAKLSVQSRRDSPLQPQVAHTQRPHDFARTDSQSYCPNNGFDRYEELRACTNKLHRSLCSQKCSGTADLDGADESIGADAGRRISDVYRGVALRSCACHRRDHIFTILGRKIDETTAPICMRMKASDFLSCCGLRRHAGDRRAGTGRSGHFRV